MTLVEYIKTRIKSFQDTTTHNGIWREESPGQIQSRIDELNNLLDVISANAGYGRWLRK